MDRTWKTKEAWDMGLYNFVLANLTLQSSHAYYSENIGLKTVPALVKCIGMMDVTINPWSIGAANCLALDMIP